MTWWLEIGVVMVFLHLTPPGRRPRHRMQYWQLRKVWQSGRVVVRKPVPAIEVIAVGTASRVTGVDKIKLMDPDYQVALLRTPTATLEIAVAPPIPAEQVLTRLRTPDLPPV